ncbi:hypothetical protein DPEC_G00199200 [Dallia pectoralis]|uniref:Uncharacterized protein n=1 Tax=Dallia pectoralis TaxID=75939 RepID=A0ACC2G8E6_DALPE|nr:hypothetical protein DPEC_G00199200 [Dallia pectoralis]
MEKNKVPAKKRLRVPTQKMKDLSSPPPNEQSAYVLRCATLPDWEPIEEAKLKKAFVNKCRARAGSNE